MIDPSSRYRDVPIQTIQTADGRAVRYLGRRFPMTLATPGETTYRVMSGDRPDLLAARALNDPLAFWRLADRNLMLDPCALTAAPGQTIRMPAAGATFQVAAQAAAR